MNGGIETSAEERQPAIFGRFFELPVSKASYDELPPAVQVFFEDKSKFLPSPDAWKPKNFISLWKIVSGNDIVYAAEQRKIVEDRAKAQNEDTHLVFIVRYRGETEIAHSTIGRTISYTDLVTFETTPGSPLVHTDYMAVEPDFRKQGVGYEQLRIANALSHMIFGSSLYSSDDQTPLGEVMTKGAVKRGMAIPSKKYPERFVYITTATGTDPSAGE